MDSTIDRFVVAFGMRAYTLHHQMTQQVNLVPRREKSSTHSFMTFHWFPYVLHFKDQNNKRRKLLKSLRLWLADGLAGWLTAWLPG